LKILINNIEEGYDVIQLESKGQTLPLIAIYTQDSMAYFKDLLVAGERRLRTAVTGLRVKTIPLDTSLTSFVQNINTQTEYNSIKNELEY
jgi:molybdopterin-guanine dinucleotide biosynthesis protein A